MNESNEEAEAPSKQTSEKEASSHELMLESKVPQGIKESLGLSTISTDITEVRQILLHTLEIQAEPNNPACDLLASALKVLDKALNTISEEVSSVGVHEPSDAVATEETPHIEEGEVTESPCDVRAAASERLMAVRESSKDNITLAVEKVSSLAVHESAETEPTEGTTTIDESETTASTCNASAASELLMAVIGDMAEEGTTKIDESETTASIDDFSAALAVREPSEDNITMSLAKYFSPDVQESPEALGIKETTNIEGSEINASTYNVTVASGLLLGKQESSEDNINLPVERVSSLAVHEPAKAITEEGTTNIDESEITASIHDITAELAVREFSQDNINLPVGSIHDVSAASVVRRSCEDNINLPVERVSSLAVHEPDIVMTDGETASTVEIEITTSINDVRAASAVREFSEDNINLSLERVSSPAVHEPDIVMTDGETANMVETEITTSIDDVSAASAVRESCEDNINLPVERVSSLAVHEPDIVMTDGETASTVEIEITTSINDVRAVSAVRDSSDGNITLPLQKVSSLDLHASAEALATEEMTYIDESEITMPKAMAEKGTTKIDEIEITASINDFSAALAVKAPSEDNITLSLIKSPSLDVHESAEALGTQETTTTLTSELLLGKQESSEDNINLPVERVSSLALHEPAKAIIEEGTTNINESEIIATIHDLSTASPVREFFEDNINLSLERVSSPAVHEPDIVMTDGETANMVETEITTSIDDVSAASAVRESCEDKINLPVERVSSLAVREPDIVMTDGETASMVEIEIMTSINDVRAVSAVRDSSDGNITLPLQKVSSLDLHASAEALATEELTYIDDGEITMPKVMAEEGTTKIDESEITASIDDFSAALAVREPSEDNISLSLIKSSSLNVHESTEALATEETTNIEGSEINASTCNVTVTSEFLLAKQESSVDNISLPVERVSSLAVHEPTRAIAEDGTTNIDESEITASIHDVSAASTMRELSEDNINLPVEKVSWPAVHEPDLVMTDGETANIVEIDITTSIDTVSAASAVRESSDGNITLPLEKVSSLGQHESAEALATEELTYIDESEITMAKAMAEEETTKIDESEISASIDDFSAALAVREPSEDNTTLSLTKSSSLDVHESAEALGTEETTNIEGSEINASTCNVNVTSELLLAKQESSVDNINLPVERVSSLAVHEPAKAITEEGTTNIDESEITASIHDVSAASAVRELSEDNINLPVEKVFCPAVHEPDLVMTDGETANIVEIDITTSIDAVSAASAVRESSDGNITLPLEKVSSLGQHESAEAPATEELTYVDEGEITMAKTMAEEGTTKIDESEISASIDDFSAALAVREPSEDNTTLSLIKSSSLDVHESAEALGTEETTNIEGSKINASQCNVTVASELLLAKQGSSEDNINLPVERVSSLAVHEPTKAITKEGTTNIDESEITASIHDITAASAVREFSQENINLPVERVSSPAVHEPNIAMTDGETANMAEIEITTSIDDVSAASAVRESFDGDITLPLEKVSSLDLHESAEALATEEMTYIDESEITMPKAMAGERTTKIDESEITASIDDFSAALVVREPSEDNITLSLIKSSSMDVHESAEGLGTEETTNIDGSEINASTCNVTVASELLLAKQGSSEDNINLPVERVSSLAVHKPAKAITEEGTTNIDGSEITASIHDITAASAVREFSQDNISLPVERVSSPAVHEPDIAMTDGETANMAEIKITTSIDDVSAAPAVRESSDGNITLPLEKVSSLDLHESAEALATEEMTYIDESEITMPKAMAGERTTKIDESEITASIDDFSAALVVREPSEDNVTLSLIKSSPLDVHESAEGFGTEETANIEGTEIDASTCNVTVASELLLGKQESPEDNINLPVERVSSLAVHEPTKAITEEGTTNIDKSEITASLHDVSAALTVTEFSEDNINLRVERVSSLGLHESAEALATEEMTYIDESEITMGKTMAEEGTTKIDESEITASVDDFSAALAVREPSEVKITPSLQKGSSLHVHETAEGLGTEEIDAPTSNVSVASELLMGVQTSLEDNINLPVERVSSLAVNESAKAITEEGTTNIDESEITGSIDDVSAASAVRESSEVERSFSSRSLRPRKRKRSSDNSIESCEHHSRDCSEICEPLRKSRRCSENIVNLCQSETSELVMAERETSDDSDTPHLEKVSLLEVYKSDEVKATDKTTSMDKCEITASKDTVIADSKRLVAEQESPEDITPTVEKLFSLDVHEPVKAVETVITASADDVSTTSELVMAVGESSRDDITLPEENASSLDVPEQAEALVERSFSNKSLRPRKRKRSSDNSIESCEHHSRHCSEICEPLRKSRRCSENIANLCQSETSEPVMAVRETSDDGDTLPLEQVSLLEVYKSDEVNATDETTSIDKCESTASRDNVIADSDLLVAVQESPKDNITPMVEKVFALDVHEPAKAVAVGEILKDNITLPMETVFSLAGHEPTTAESTEGANDIDESEITASRCNATAASELVMAMEEASEHTVTLPVEKCPSMDLYELSEGIAGEETTVIDESEITTSTCNVTAASELVMAVGESFADNITLPLEKLSSLDVHESSEAVATQDANFYESEITVSAHNVIAGPDLFLVVDEYFDGNITLPKEKVSSVDEANHAEVIATDVTTSKDESEITASIYDVSAAPRGLFAVEGSAEDITLPVENVSSLDVLKPAEAILTDETTVTDESEITTSIHGFSAASELLMPVEKIASLDVHEPANVVATEVERSLSNRSLRPRKRKRTAETAIEGSGHVSTNCSVHKDIGEPVRKSKRCLLNSGAETAASTSKANIAPAVLSEGAEAAATEAANIDKIKIKTEGIPAPNSGVETPDTMGYVHYYLRTAYQLLFGAMMQDPAGTPPLESIIQQSREATAEPSQRNRARRRRVRRVWNGEAFVPEGQKREQAEPYLRRRRPRRN